MKQLSPEQAEAVLAHGEAILLDVREPLERELASLPGSLDIPMGELPSRLADIPRDTPVIVMCHHGVRSAMAGDFLERNGFSAVSNLEGGIDAWSCQVSPDIPRY